MTDTALYHWYEFEGSVNILVPKLQVLPCSHPTDARHSFTDQ